MASTFAAPEARATQTASSALQLSVMSAVSDAVVQAAVGADAVNDAI